VNPGRQLGFLWGGVAAALLLAAPFLATPAGTALALSLPPCLFRALTGLPCVACGSTHALLALGRLDVGAALAMNPLAAAALLALVAGGLVAGVRALAGKSLPEPVRWPRWTRLLAAALLAANWAWLLAAVGCSSSPRPTAPRPTRLERPGQVTYGTSVEGRPLEVQRVGPAARTAETAKTAKTVLLFSNIHGSEVDAAPILDEVVARVTADPALASRLTLLVIRRVNPDGFERETRRNARGVDVNRNFPTGNFVVGNPADRYYGGAEPFSEPETRALAALVEKETPAAVVAIHSALKVVNYDGPAAELAKAIAVPLGYRVDAEIGYPTPGSFGTWAGRERGIPVVTLELPKYPTPEESAAAVEGLLAALGSGLSI